MKDGPADDLLSAHPCCTPFAHLPAHSRQCRLLEKMADPPVLGELEQLILLAILRLGPDAYGLSVARELESYAGRRLSRGALYTSLQRLETKGLIRWRNETGGPAREGMPKRVYSVTSRGIAAVRESHRVLKRMWRGLEDVLKGSTS
jgi:PadR family transcriptional regulator, regulatory protein PadR